MDKIRHATIFTTALCNLNCAYCYICKDKDGNLKQIDDDIARDFAANQYIKQILAYGEDVDKTLDALTLWGGEPFLHMERFSENLEEWFKAFPNLKKIDTSTNFTIPNQYKIIEDLLDKIAKYSSHHMTFDLQISIDGYKEMNDCSRGEGVTERFLENFRGLCKINYDRSKISLNVHTKPTLARKTFQYLDTPEKCDKWFRFFDEEMFTPYEQADHPFTFGLALYNCATPSEWTKEDGIEFAKIMRNMQSVNFKKYKGWNRSGTAVPIAASMVKRAIDMERYSYSVKRCGGSCGSFITSIVPIPHNMYTMCHRGLFDEYVDYCNNIQQRDNLNDLANAYFNPRNAQEWIFDLDGFKKMHNSLCPLNCRPNQVIYTDWVISIREYAKAGIIDSKWESVKMIEKILPYFMENSYCMQDSYIFTGSWTTMSPLEIPLLFNGAMDVALEELARVQEEGERR